MKNKTAWGLLVAAFLGGFSSVSWADDDTADYIKSRTYVGGLGIYTNIDGGGFFNGASAFQFNGNVEVDLIPAIDRNFGFGVLVGHREGPYAGEVSFWRTDHNGTWGPFPPVFPTVANGVVCYQSFNIDFKRYLFTHLPSQPFFSVGVSFPWLVARQASGENSTGAYRFADMSISGVGVNLAAGMEFYVGNDYSFVGGVQHRWAGFSQITGALKQNFTTQLNGADINLDGNGLNFFAGATIGFE